LPSAPATLYVLLNQWLSNECTAQQKAEHNAPNDGETRVIFRNVYFEHDFRDLELSHHQFQFFRKLFTGLFTVTYNCHLVITGVLPLRRGFLHDH